MENLEKSLAPTSFAWWFVFTMSPLCYFYPRVSKSDFLRFAKEGQVVESFSHH